jgi:hypothetical protein
MRSGEGVKGGKKERLPLEVGLKRRKVTTHSKGGLSRNGILNSGDK